MSPFEVTIFACNFVVGQSMSSAMVSIGVCGAGSSADGDDASAGASSIAGDWLSGVSTAGGTIGFGVLRSQAPSASSASAAIRIFPFIGRSPLSRPQRVDLLDQAPCRSVMVRGRRPGPARRGKFGKYLHRQRLAELDPPLVEGIDPPDDALTKHLVLIKRDQRAQSAWRQPLEQDRIGRVDRAL